MTTVARLMLIELTRRRGTMALLVLLPLAFYLARHDLPGQSTRLLSLGLGWTVASLALFVAIAAAGPERRLRVAGFSTTALLAGRWLATTAVGCALAMIDLLIVVVDQRIERIGAIAAMLVLAVLLGGPLGTLLAALLPRELEGALALLIVLSVQLLADPDQALAKAMPFWSLRQLGTYAVDGAPSSYLWSALAHAAITWAVVVAGMWLLTAHRLRLHAPPPPRPDSTAPSNPAA